MELLDVYGTFYEFSLWTRMLITTTLLWAGFYWIRTMTWVYKRSLNDEKRRKKQETSQKSIEDLREKLSKDPMPESEVDRIGSLTLRALMEELRSGKLTPRTVLKVYQTKALKVHEKTNCITEVIKEADEWARRLENGPAGGILWGIPISVKDDVGIKGYDCCLGEMGRAFHPMKDDAELIKILRREGAIPFVKTTVPQGCIAWEPGCPVNGLVYNPHNHEHGPGGSGSGEGALVGAGGSILGICSDMAGSIRVPAHFCGCTGFKATPERVSSRGMCFDEPAVMFPVKPVWGPMARDVDSLVILMRTIFENSPNTFDPEIVPLPFKSDLYSSKRRLTVGFYNENGLFPTTPACKRAIDMAKEIFIKEGHQVVPWQLPDPEYCYWLFFRVVQADGGQALHEMLKYDRTDKTIDAFIAAMRIPKFFRYMLSKLLIYYDKRAAGFVKTSCGISNIYAYQELLHELIVYRRRVEESWRDAGLDLVVSPPHPMPAPPFGQSELLMMSCSYTLTYNVLQYPAGVVRMTTVNQTDIQNLNKYPTTDKWETLAKQVNLESLGLPVGVQVVASRYRDEVALRGMRILERGCQLPPIT